ncbi:hypothetical protein VIGAN_02032200, partial [Vigna angularis var. angularis]
MMMKWNFECVKDDWSPHHGCYRIVENQLGILFVSFEDFWSKLSSVFKDSNTIFTSELSQRSTWCRPSLASLHGECGFQCPTKQ